MTLTSLTPAGLVLARFTELFAQFGAAGKALWGQSLDTGQTEYIGHMYNQCSLLLAELNDVFAEVADVQSAINVTGDRQDHLFALVGVYRGSGSNSKVTETYTVDRATTIPAGHRMKTLTGLTFRVLENHVAAGAGTYDVEMECTVEGPFDAAIGEVNIPVSSFSGFVSATNAAAATPGAYRQTDGQFRAAHTAAVETSGERDTASIELAVRAVDGVSDARCVDDKDAHTITVSVIGGDPADIATAIDQNITGGIPTLGDQSVEVYSETSGQNETINYYEGANKQLYLSAVLTKNSALFPADGNAQLKALLTAYALENYRLGSTVDYRLLQVPFSQVAGVVINELYIGWSASPTGEANLTTTILERPFLQEANIEISYTS